MGLYQAIYGINPLYNRFYLDPHITTELAGTSLKYNFRGKHLTINLDSNGYSVADKTFKVAASGNFGFNSKNHHLFYFNGNQADVAMEANTSNKLSIEIKIWNSEEREWIQNAGNKVVYILHQLKGFATYSISINGKITIKAKSNAKGELIINSNAGSCPVLVKEINS